MIESILLGLGILGVVFILGFALLRMVKAPSENIRKACERDKDE